MPLTLLPAPPDSKSYLHLCTIMLGLHITTLTINNFDRFDSDAQISYLYLYPSPKAKAFNSVMGSNARECSNGLKYKLGSEVYSVKFASIFF